MDPKSFLARPPSKWRWARRIAAVVLFVGAVYAFAPTGYARATLRLAGPGNRGELITRYSLLPPIWLGDVRYPFWSFHEHHDDERLAATQAPEDVTALNYLTFHARPCAGEVLRTERQVRGVGRRQWLSSRGLPRNSG